MKALSARIRELEHDWYKDMNVPLVCAGKLRIIRLHIRKLEAVARAAQRMMKNEPTLIHGHGNDAVSLRVALKRLEGK